jgi:hypothetical protein
VLAKIPLTDISPFYQNMDVGQDIPGNLVIGLTMME